MSFNQAKPVEGGDMAAELMAAQGNPVEAAPVLPPADETAESGTAAETEIVAETPEVVAEPAKPKAERRIVTVKEGGKQVQKAVTREEFDKMKGASEEIWNKLAIDKSSSKYEHRIGVEYSGYGASSVVATGADLAFRPQGLHAIDIIYGGRYPFLNGRVRVGFNAGIKVGIAEQITDVDGQVLAERKGLFGLLLDGIVEVKAVDWLYVVAGLRIAGYFNNPNTGNGDNGEGAKLFFVAPSIGANIVFNPKASIKVGAQVMYRRNIMPITNYTANTADGDVSNGVKFGGAMGANEVGLGMFIAW